MLRPLFGCLFLFVATVSTRALGQTQDELDDIQRALDADTAAQSSSRPTPEPADSAPARFLQSLNPDISFIADVALGWFSTKEPLQTGGHDPKKTGFTLQQLELAVGSSVDPYFRFDANIVFSQFGVEIEEVYATTLALPGRFQLRLGQFLTRFGRINPTHPHAWHFVDQPFIIGRVFGGEGNRGLGVEGSWLAPLPWYVELVGSVTDAAGEATARSFYGPDDLGVRSPLDVQSTAALKQFFPFSDDWSLLVGLSAATGPNPTGRWNRSDVYGGDLYLKYRPTAFASQTIVSLQAEWLYRRRQVPGDVLHDHGGYAYLFWRFAQRWGTALRYELGSPSRRADGSIATDALDPLWRQSRQRISANLTFWPSEFSRVRLQGSSDVPGWQPRPTWAALLAFEFAVGAHGAHAF